MRMVSMSCLCIRNELGFSWAALLILAGFTHVLGSAAGLIYAECSWDKRTPTQLHLLLISSRPARACPCDHGNIAKEPTPFPHGDQCKYVAEAKVQGWSLLPCPWGQSSPQLQGKCKNVGRGEELPLTPSASPGVWYLRPSVFIYDWGTILYLTHLVRGLD